MGKPTCDTLNCLQDNQFVEMINWHFTMMIDK